MKDGNAGSMRALIVDVPWIDLILDGDKVWEMRTRAVRIRGRIGLIRKGSGLVVGTATLVASLEPLTAAGYAEAQGSHGIPPDRQPGAISGGWLVPWVLSDRKRLATPVPYVHPRGAVTWIALPEEVSRAVEAST